jgi:hypothetical protein
LQEVHRWHCLERFLPSLGVLRHAARGRMTDIKRYVIMLLLVFGADGPCSDLGGGNPDVRIQPGATGTVGRLDAPDH